MSASDWTVALDDAFCARLRHCTRCGRMESSLWFDIWQGPTAITVAVVLCERCRAAEPTHHTLSALMERRYGAVRQKTS
jgi:hypothetical protein